LLLAVNGNNFNTSSIVTMNGFVLPTSFVSSSQLLAFVPGNLLNNAGVASISVTNPVIGSSNPIGFFVLDNPPTAFAVPTQGASSRNVTLNGFFTDLAVEPHFAVFVWGDGTVQFFVLGSNNGRTFTLAHKYGKHQKPVTITVFVLDDEGAVSNVLKFPVSFK
jgi:hypothetical protein